MIELNDEQKRAVRALTVALSYPQDAHGNVMPTTALAAPLALHLTRAGFRLDPEKATIKPRTLPHVDGVIIGAQEWVPIDAPDYIEMDLSKIDTSDPDALHPMQRALLLRQGAAPSDQIGEDAWRVSPQIDQSLLGGPR